MDFLKKHYGLFGVLILSFWAIKSLLAPGFFPMHDDTQVARVYEMAKVLKAGVFPVRSVPDLGYGYGYPIFNFYAPLSYYVGATFMFVGFDALVATKIMMVLGIVLAGVFMYLLAREFLGELGGIVAGLFYIYTPYHAVDIFVRGDVAEFWAYAFIPLVFLGVYRKSILVGSLGFAAIILSHNLTAMMITPFLLALILFSFYASDSRKKTVIKLLAILIFGVATPAFYWIPALLEMKNTNVLSQIGEGANFRDNFVCINQLWSGPWGFGGSIKGCVDGISFMIGKLYILVALLALLVAIKTKRARESNVGKIVIFSFLGFITSVFFMLEISKPIWELIYPMAFFQYPWRFLILVSFFSSVLAGGLLSFFKYPEVKFHLLALFLIVTLVFFGKKFFVPQAIYLKTATDYTNEKYLKWTVSKISDEYLPPNFEKPKDENGIYKGVSSIKVAETPIEKASNTVSVISLLVLLIVIIINRKKQYE